MSQKQYNTIIIDTLVLMGEQQLQLVHSWRVSTPPPPSQCTKFNNTPINVQRMTTSNDTARSHSTAVQRVNSLTNYRLHRLL